jgi:hypothetical protein
VADEQRLNSLERFRKQPGRLVLEEHSHCEVPAGCGGVVLRWRNPLATLPVTLHLWMLGRAACRLDGAEVQTARVDLAPGRHALAVVLEQVDLSAGLILFAGTFEPHKEKGTSRSELTERPLKVLTAADGTWKYSLTAPATDEWTSPAFDDRDWPALAAAPAPQLGEGGFGPHQVRQCVRLGAACLGLPLPSEEKERVSWWQRLLGRAAPSGPGATPHPNPPPQGGRGKDGPRGSVWVRKVFEVPAPEVADPPS